MSLLFHLLPCFVYMYYSRHIPPSLFSLCDTLSSLTTLNFYYLNFGFEKMKMKLHCTNSLS